MVGTDDTSKYPRQWEYVIPILTAASLFIACIIVSSKKPFWNDELLSFYLLSDRSLIHMLVAWTGKFNQAPPLYFILGWAWAKVFGATELSLRLFSSLSLSVAFTAIWLVLRRTYSFWVATISTSSVFCLSELVLYHNAETRMYGLFAAVCALGFLKFDSLNRSAHCSWKSLLINSCIHAAMVLTHLYGIFYSAAILAAAILSDRYFGRFRKNVYLSIVLGWLVLVPLLPLLVNQSNNSAKWFLPVGFLKLLDFLTFSSKTSWLLLALLIVSAALYLANSTYKASSQLFPNFHPNLSAEAPSLIFAGSFLGVPVAAWLITKTIKPILNDRYIIPTITIVWSILLAYLSCRIFSTCALGAQENKGAWSKFPLHMLQAVTLSVFVLALLAYPIYYARVTYPDTPRPGRNDSTYGYVELPIAVEAGQDFLPRFYYSSKPSRYFHILDWETAVRNTESAFATGDYVHLEALSDNYPLIQSIQSEEFLGKYDRFLILNEDNQKWFETRVERNPIYRVQRLGTEPGAYGGLLDVILVEKS